MIKDRCKKLDLRLIKSKRKIYSLNLDNFIYFIYEEQSLSYVESMELKKILKLYNEFIVVIRNIRFLFEKNDFCLVPLYDRYSYFCLAIDVNNFLNFFKFKGPIFYGLLKNDKLNYINFISVKKVKYIDIRFRYKLIMLFYNNIIYCNKYVITLLNFYNDNFSLVNLPYSFIMFLYGLFIKIFFFFFRNEYVKSNL